MSAWLVRITLNPADSVARRDLTDVVRLHQRVMTLAPDGIGDKPRQQAGLLFRVEHHPYRGRQLLVQARVEPVTRRIPKTYGTVEVRDLQPLLDALTPGMAIAYRLTANASKRLGRSSGPMEGKVVALRGTEADEWWAARASQCGMRLHSLHAQRQDDMVGDVAGSRCVRHAVTCFEGVAIVTDVDRVRAAILAGVGRGKSHGCGLLSIAPLKSAGASG